MAPESFSDYMIAYNSIKKSENISGTHLKIAVLRSFSSESIERLLTVDAYNSGFTCDFFFGGFNQYPQEILDHASSLYAYKPDIVLLMINIEDICPQVFSAQRIAEVSDINVLSKAINEFFGLISILHSRIGGAIIINNFMQPMSMTETYYDSVITCGFGNLVRTSNINLLESVKNLDNTYIFDLERLSGRLGRDNIYDTKQWYISKNPYSIRFYMALSQSYAGMINAIHNKRRKCIILDLDNTLWKGIIGEDGFTGIEINDSFKDFQKQLKFWQTSGILLAVNSKNNIGDALEVFERHPDMFLKKDDFSILTINWDDKASNVKRIAEELNIGQDSMIFLDDSEFECEIVRQECPDVYVVWLDGNYSNYANIAKNLPLLDFVILSDEDVARTKLYHEQAERKTFEKSSTSLTGYLEALGTKITIGPVDETTLARAAQLTQKTNQFNLTTKRYTVDDLKRMQSEGFLIYTVSIADKFGDNGLTGIVIIDTSGYQNKEWKIDSFLLSCRIMSRDIEKGIWSYIVTNARSMGIEKIKGEYIPTKKNKPAENLLPSLGFVEVSGSLQYNTNTAYKCPHYIELNHS